ncbi:glycosyltransferase family 4 protein [Paludibaculum fermentans]|uniref:glycosyltransferase family 4 protein n=1 Tax=Paludibaculum fermentans TaxID=1473598 RepID=UPI003EBE290B
MRIAVNVRHYLKGRIGGQENYLQGILRGLAQRGQELTVFAQPSEREAVRELVAGPVDVRPIPEEGRPMIRAMAGGGFDLLFCPLHTLEPLDPPIPSAVMIPDLQHEFFPAYFDDRELARRCRNYEASAKNASQVLTCSEYSKRTIVERYQVATEKVVVCGHGVDGAFLAGGPAPEELIGALGLPDEYLYFPAFYWPHKNHANALQALRLVRERGAVRLHLVCTGGGDRARVQALVDELGLGERVRLLGRVESELVPELYRRSRGLLFPTLFEGFGIPVLEAMHLGVPVITSQGGAAEEVAGGCAVLVKPEDPASIAEGIGQVISGGELIRRLEGEGRARAAGFTWERAVDTTLAALQRVAVAGYRAPPQIEVAEWPVVSVALVGEEPAMASALDSVVTQEYPHVEWRAVREAGAAGFTGALLNVLRPGDAWLPGAAARVAQAWRRNPRAGVIYGLARVGEGLMGTAPFVYEDLNYGPVWARAAAFYGRAAWERAEGSAPADGGGPEGAVLGELRVALRVARGHAVIGLPECLAEWGNLAALDSVALERLRSEAIALMLEHFAYVPPEWMDGRSVLRLLGGSGAMSGRWRSLWRGLAANRGRRQRYWREWRQDGGSR